VTEERVVNQQLVQAAKLATLGEMATGIAHELNQPLSVIRLAAEGLVERIDDGDRDIGMIRDKLDRIGRQTARAAAIIDHMRIFGRKAEGPTVAFDPRRAVEDALGIVGERLRLRGIDVRLDLGADCAAVRGHPILLEQVVLNLLTNAFDALELREDAAGTASIEVRVRGESGGREVRIDIRDNGGGVSEAVIRRVFEPFVTTKPVGKGTGLGLSVSYGIVTDMGGSISVRNADGGAEFTIVLPAAGAEGATAA
jgi:C4-dicarboxylate-specific signal transduction histidine kinase